MNNFSPVLLTLNVLFQIWKCTPALDQYNIFVIFFKTEQNYDFTVDLWSFDAALWLKNLVDALCVTSRPVVLACVCGVGGGLDCVTCDDNQSYWFIVFAFNCCVFSHFLTQILCLRCVQFYLFRITSSVSSQRKI